MNDANHPDTTVPHRHGAEEKAYLLLRADDHRRLAEQAEEPGSKTIHTRLEQLYRERADQVNMVLINHE